MRSEDALEAAVCIMYLIAFRCVSINGWMHVLWFEFLANYIGMLLEGSGA